MRLSLALIALTALLVLASGCGGGDDNSEAQPTADLRANPTANVTDAALQELINNVNDNPSADGYLKLGNAYTERARFSDAIDAYQKGLAINPNHPTLLANMGVALYQLGRFNEAQEQFQKALKLKSDDAATTYLLGATFLQMGDQTKAEEMFKKALEIDPTLPEAHFGLGALYALQGKKDQAIAEFETFLAGPPAQDPRAKSEAERYLKQLKSGQ